MLDHIVEKTSLWDYLKETKKPIVVYGTGIGSSKIIKILKDKGISLKAIMVNYLHSKHHNFNGYNIYYYEELKAKYKDFIILLAFAVNTNEMLEEINHLSNYHEVYSPDIPVVGDGLFDYNYLVSNISEFKDCYNILHDDLSKQVYVDIINFKISGKLNYLTKCQTDRKDIFNTTFKLLDNEIFFDAGAYNGDTIKEFIEMVPNYEKVIAVEPDKKNYLRLIKYVRETNLSNVECFNYAIWEDKAVLLFNNKSSRASCLVSEKGDLVPTISVDHILNGDKVTFIKYDIEGAEKEGLLGAINTIKTYRPKLEVAAYHRLEDLIILPNLIKKICSDYKIFLRHQPYIPAWETNIFAIV